MKREIISTILIGAALNISAQLSENPKFMSYVQPKSSIITDYNYKDTVPSNCALVRMDNGKIVFMTRQEGELKPFFIKAIETGYWDTRYDKDTDYDKVFADMRNMGANTAYVMIHWEEIEKSDNKFDFTFSDSIVAAAERQGLKVNWILFLHTQANGVPPCGAENAWTFHLDDRDSCNYTMQWPKRKGEIYKNVNTLVEKGGIRPLHVYGHPEIFGRIRRMLYNLAVHYRNSNTVIGVQLGNEEGFSFLDESDYNPVTKSLYEEWKLKTNKADYAQFKKEAINWWWKQFTSAYHEGDPYKILSFNLDAAQAEADDMERVDMTGTSASTYADGNLDAIGTMFYKQWGYKAILGLDRRYNEGSYNYRLPVLVPSEIGIGRFNSDMDFNSFVMHTLERGALGFGVYCYGEVRKELNDTMTARNTLIKMFEAIRQNEDIISRGLPGPGNVYCTISKKNFNTSHLNYEGNTLALLYVSSFIPSSNDSDKNAEITIKARKEGLYEIKVLRNSTEIIRKKVFLRENGAEKINIPNIESKDIFFISCNILSDNCKKGELTHSTYVVGDKIKNKKFIERINFRAFDNIYLMAAPAWKYVSFKDSRKKILAELVKRHSYKSENGIELIPYFIKKAHESGVKVFISFAGEGFPEKVNDEDCRNNFIQFMVEFMKKYDYDGIEIDWESGLDLNLHAELLKGIRTCLDKEEACTGKKLYLTTALHSWQKYSKQLAKKLSASVNWINLMTYDMGGGIWGYQPLHNTPMNKIKNELDNWKYFEKDKLCLGLANYGFKYEGIRPGERTEEKLSKYGKYFSYKDFVPLLKAGWKKQYDYDAKVYYYLSPDNNSFITMECPETIKDKIKWISDKKYKGVFWWEFSYDIENEEICNEPINHYLIDLVK